MRRFLASLLAAVVWLCAPVTWATDATPLKIDHGQTKQFGPTDTVPVTNGGTGSGSAGVDFIFSGPCTGFAGSPTFKLPCNPFPIGSAIIQQITGTPSSTLAAGSLSMESSPVPSLWLSGNPSSVTPTFIQNVTGSANNSATVTLSLPNAPISGDVLIAQVCYSNALPTVNTAGGWFLFPAGVGDGPSHSRSGTYDPYCSALWHLVGNGETASQSPATVAGGANTAWSAAIEELSGMDPQFTSSLQTIKWTSNNNAAGAPSTSQTATTLTSNDIAIALGFQEDPGGSCGTPHSLSIGGTTWGQTNTTTQLGVLSAPGFGSVEASQMWASSGTTVTSNVTGVNCLNAAMAMTSALIVIQPPTGGAARVSLLSTIKSGGTVIETNPISVNYSTCLTGTSDGSGNVTVTAGQIANCLTLSSLPQIAADTYLGNPSGSTANVSAVAWPSCSGAADALTYNTTSHGLVCNSAVNAAQLNGATFASPGAIGGTTAGSGKFSSLQDTGIASGTQCLQADASGNITGTGSGCGSSSGATISGTPTAGHCASWFSSTAIQDSGAACGGGGGSTTIVQPQGRLTLVTGTPVMTSDQTAKSTIYYDCYVGNGVPYYTGSADAMDTISSCEVSLTMVAGASTVGGDNTTTGGINNAGVFDVWWVHGGASRICIANGAASAHSGGGWSSDTAGSTTARGTGYSAVHNTRGYWTNTNAITHCWNGSTDYGSVSADQATYLGSLYTTAAGQTGVQFRAAAAAGGASPVMGLFNAYNRVPMASRNIDNTSSWSYNSATWRASDNSSSNRVSYVDGLGQVFVSSRFMVICSSAASQNTDAGLDFDSTSATPATYGVCNTNAAASVTQNLTVEDTFTPSVGLHFVQGVENVTGGTGSFFSIGGAGYQIAINVVM